MARAKKTETVDAIWKPLAEEFFLEQDYGYIATNLGRDIEEIDWFITDEERDGVPGHILAGVPK